MNLVKLCFLFQILPFYCFWYMVEKDIHSEYYMQINSLEKTFEQERKALKLRVFELEKKLEGVNQELAVLQSTLTTRNSEIATLQNNLKELDELREMKEVMTGLFCKIFLSCLDVFYF